MSFLCQAVFFTCDKDALGGEIDRRDLAPLVHLGTPARRMADEDFVEFRAPDLIGMGHGFVPCVGEMKGLCPLVIRREKFRPRLAHADGLDFVRNVHFLEQGQICRQQGFANMRAWMVGFLKQDHAMAAFR